MKASHSKLTAGILAVGFFLNGSVMAAAIVGGISFTGGYTPSDPILADADFITITPGTVKTVSASPGSSFEFIANGTDVETPTILEINDAEVPQPDVPIWSVAGFSLTLETLDQVLGPFNTLTLFGTGIITGPEGYDPTPGDWIATFQGSGGVTFSWSASSSSTPGRVPDGGSAIALLGMSLLGIEGIRRKLISRKS